MIDLFIRGLEPETIAYSKLTALTIAQQKVINDSVKLAKGAGFTKTDVTLLISNYTGALFLTLPSYDFRWAKGLYVTLTSGGKNFKALVSDVGTGETLSSELITSHSNISGSEYETLTVNANGHDITQAVNSALYGSSVSNAFTEAVGGLYKIVTNLTVNSGFAPFLFTANSSYTAGGEFLSYNPAVARLPVGETTTYFNLQTTGYNYLVSTVLELSTDFACLCSLKRATAPTNTGIIFTSPTVDAGFNYNAVIYTLTITKS